MKESKYIIALIVVSFILGGVLGNSIKKCEKCPECVHTPPNKVIERFDDAVKDVKKEIKKETNETVKKIINDNSTHVADSVLRDYAKRFGNDK